MRVQYTYRPHHTHRMTDEVSERVNIRGYEEDGTVSECEHCGGRLVKGTRAAMADPMLNDACPSSEAYKREDSEEV